MSDLVLCLVLAALFAVITYSGWRLLKYEKWGGLVRKLVGIPVIIFGGVMTLFFILAAFVPKTPEQIAAEQVRAEQAAVDERQKIETEKQAEAAEAKKVAEQKAAAAKEKADEDARQREVLEKQEQERAVREAAENVALTGGALLLRSMNDPDSLQIIQAKARGDGSFCARYRGKNGFGALIINELSVLGQTTSEEWREGCDSSDMLDFSKELKSYNESGLLARLADELST